MAEPNKKVQKNPLLSSAVTGSTVEDFSQNALLLPPQQIPVPSTDGQHSVTNLLPVVAESTANTGSESLFQTTQSTTIAPPPTQKTSYNPTPVFSAISTSLQSSNYTLPPHAEQATKRFQDETAVNVANVPLYSSDLFIQNQPTSVNAPNSVPPPTPSAGANTFRRTAVSRPIYAPIPGLMTSNNNQTTVQTYENLQKTKILSHVLGPSAPSSTPPYRTTSSAELPGQINQSTPSSILAEYTPQVAASASTPLVQPAVSQTNFDTTIQPVIISDSGHTGTYPSQPAEYSKSVYRPVYHHWFHKNETENNRVTWNPFSMMDSLALEAAFTSNDLDPDRVVATDGDRFDVNILHRKRVPVYWSGTPNEVRRCSWFFKDTNDSRFIPYEENVAIMLEDEYRTAFEAHQWPRRFELPNRDTVVFQAPDVFILFEAPQSLNPWSSSPSHMVSKVVKRGMDEFDIDEGEPMHVDHLLFMIHGIGSVCDLKFRKVEEVVDDFRSISLQLVRSHYASAYEKGAVHRMEVLPISWHKELHSESTGIDQKLKNITLKSIPRFRDFTNDTLMDILLYTSPAYCQNILSTVGNEINRIYALFKKRKPNFKGGVSLGGHSLGSLILFDLLNNQDRSSADTVPKLYYPRLSFDPYSFFALGSPIGMFLTVRGLDNLGEDFALPTCRRFFNIFHPYDPVAYRIESLINPELSKVKPELIPHHKGRKRMHLELKDTVTRMGQGLKLRIFESMKSTWNSVYQLAMFHRNDPQTATLHEEQVDMELQEKLVEAATAASANVGGDDEADSDGESAHNTCAHLSLGKLNSQRRIDYVLQEAPFEIFNDYIFALTSHVVYWVSEDTMLLILKEIYGGMGIKADNGAVEKSVNVEEAENGEEAAGPGASTGLFHS